MQEKADIYSSNTNFHEKIILTENTETTVTDIYQKSEKKLVVISKTSTDTTTSLYYNNIKCDMFYESPEGKRAKLSSSATLIEPLITNYVEVSNNWSTFLASLCTSIKKIEYNGADCYHMTGNLDSVFWVSPLGKKEMYINKDTGLCLKLVYSNGKTINCNYEFNNVSDTVFVEPDISQYTLIEE